MQQTATRTIDPAAISRMIPRQQMDALRAAANAGRDAVAAFIQAEQDKRNKSADAEYGSYMLWKVDGDKFYRGVKTPDHYIYEESMTTEGVKRYTDCPDQEFVDDVNFTARRFSLVARLETKHARIAYLLERDLFAGQIAWKAVEGGFEA